MSVIMPRGVWIFAVFLRQGERIEVASTMQHEAPDTSVRAHESGYIMRRGEHLVLAQESTSPEGQGWLLVTNMEFLWIHHTKGIYLHVEHDMIDTVKGDKDKLIVKWTEKGRKYDFQMRLKEGYYTVKEVAKTLDIRFRYAGVTFEHVALDANDVERARNIRVTHFETKLSRLQERIRAIEVGEAEDDGIDDWKSLANSIKRNLKCSKTMPFVRSAKVPAHVPLASVWNDCYYDEKREIYVTFHRFPNGIKPETQANQARLGYEGDGVAFSKKEVHFEYGYPVVAAVPCLGILIEPLKCRVRGYQGGRDSLRIPIGIERMPRGE